MENGLQVEKSTLWKAEETSATLNLPEEDLNHSVQLYIGALTTLKINSTKLTTFTLIHLDH